MAVNDFLTFAGDPAANVMLQSDYAATGFTSRILGFSTGTAYSIQCNKVWRQATLISNMIAQFSVNATGNNMHDDGSPTGITNLLNTFTSAVQLTAQRAVGSGWLPLTGGTLTGNLIINSAAAGPDITINAPAGQSVEILYTRPAGQYAYLQSQTGTAATGIRWQLQLATNEAETGNNAGSNFFVSRFSDAGAYLDAPFSINRATGVVNFAHAPTIAGGRLPYVQLSGDTMTGPLTVGSTGISYSSYYGGHFIAFGWSGSNIAMYVDNTFEGWIANQSYISTELLRYLPLTGGTLSGALTINSSLTVGYTNFTSSVNFVNDSNFAIYQTGTPPYQIKVFQWASGWIDYWNTSNGQRVWACWAPAGSSTPYMALDGSANLSVTGTLRVTGDRIISQGVGPSVAVYYTDAANNTYLAEAIWIDTTNFVIGTCDGNGGPLTWHMAINHASGAVSIANSMGIDGSLTINGSLGVVGGIWGDGRITAGNGGVYIGGNGITFPSINANMEWHLYWDGRQMFLNNGIIQVAPVMSDGSYQVSNMHMYTNNLAWQNPSTGVGWFVSSYTSDARLKENIKPAEKFDSLMAICNVPLVQFHHLREDRHVPYGILAQDLEKSLPDTVIELPDDEHGTVLQPNLLAIIAHLFRAIQQLEARLA